MCCKREIPLKKLNFIHLIHLPSRFITIYHDSSILHDFSMQKMEPKRKTSRIGAPKQQLSIHRGRRKSQHGSRGHLWQKNHDFRDCQGYPEIHFGWRCSYVLIGQSSRNLSIFHDFPWPCLITTGYIKNPGKSMEIPMFPPLSGISWLSNFPSAGALLPATQTKMDGLEELCSKPSTRSCGCFAVACAKNIQKRPSH